MPEQPEVAGPFDDIPADALPSVLVAAFGETVLQEEDDGPLSIIRIQESIRVWAEYTVGGDGPTEGIEDEPIHSDLQLLVMLRGIPDGKHTLQITVVRPDGERVPQGMEGEFEGGGSMRGANLRMRIRAGFVESGIYFFDIGYDRRALLSRIPLEVVVDRQIRRIHLIERPSEGSPENASDPEEPTA